MAENNQTEDISAFQEMPEEQPDSQMADASGSILKDAFDATIVNNEYSFSQTLACHEGSVRSLAYQKGAETLMSGSIDFSNKLYTKNKATGQYEYQSTTQVHEGFVMDIIPSVNGTAFFSASKDKKIMMIDTQGNPTLEFVGHEQPVNSLSQATENELVSGSWDGTAKIWDTTTGECKATLEGHAHGVSVLTLPNGITITGSQDGKIRLWYDGQQQKEFHGHDDIVRGFCEVPQLNGFASISNDEVVKLWSMDGTHMMDFKGHGGFIFSVDCLETGEIITGGDDCTVKLWQDGKCKQTIQLPRTVWSVTHDQWGDIIVGTEDKKIRTFTRDPARQDRESPAFTEYEEECKAAAQGGEQLDMSKLPDFKTQVEGKIRGKSDGFVQVFKEDNVAFAFMWSDAESKWNKIGEVQNPGQAAQETGQGGAGGIGATTHYPGDTLFAAGEYDKVIDVDLGDGVFRKLPCNNGANYLETADKFCARENLGRSYVEQIVQFLRANTLPYATREIDAPPSDDQLMNQVMGAMVKTCKRIPHTTHIYYDQIKVDGPAKKIREFITELGTIEGQELIYLESMFKVLSATQNYMRSEVSPQQVKVIDKLLAFPIEKAFPCMDLYRIYLLHPTSYEAYASSDAGAQYIQAMLRFISNENNPKALCMLTLRGLCNLFKNQASSHVAMLNASRLIDAVLPFLTHADKNVRQAAITMHLNYSVELQLKDNPEARTQVIAGIATCIGQETDLQNILRASITLGNCAHKNAEAQSLISSMGLEWPAEGTWVAAAGEAGTDATKQTIKEIRALFID